jgi:hypothetical protein
MRQSLPLDERIIHLLRALRESGGKIQFPEFEPEPFAPIIVDEAQRAGLVRHNLGPLWRPTETVEITAKGLRAIGAPESPSRWLRLWYVITGRVSLV